MTPRAGCLVALCSGLLCCGGKSAEAPPPNPGPPAAQSFTLRVSPSGSGAVTSSPVGIDCGQICSAKFAAGTQVTLTSAAAAGWKFSAWTGACSGPGSCTLTMAADAAVGATFEALPPSTQPPAPPPPPSETPPPAPPPLSDSCDGMTPPALPASIVAKLPDNECLGGTSDDGAGNFLLGYMVNAFHSFPNYLFFTVKNGTAQRIGDTVPGGDDLSTSVFSQPSGFSSFHVSAATDRSWINSYSHEGALTSTTLVAESLFETSDVFVSSTIAIDPSGGTALVKSWAPNSAGWMTAYRRLTKTGTPETDWVTVDMGKHPVRAVGVALSGHALVIQSLDSSSLRARWLDRDGAPLTTPFDFAAEDGFVRLAFLMDGSLALRFLAPRFPFAPGPWKHRFEDGKTTVAPVPDWLAARAHQPYYVVRNGRGYVTWGSEGQCGPRAMEVLAASGRSCGCLDVPNLGDLTSVGRDGSLIVPRPAQQFGTCEYDLYPNLLR
jgi:Divergent InlB B-repeat domain